jgi:hypothetical protein
MGGAELDHAPAGFRELLQRTLEVSLHQRTLSDFGRLRDRARICLLCPVAPPDTDRLVRSGLVEEMIEGARRAMHELLRSAGRGLFRRSGIHYLPVSAATRPASSVG